MREEFLSELVEAISNWPEVVATAEGGSQARDNQDGLAGVTERTTDRGLPESGERLLRHKGRYDVVAVARDCMCSTSHFFIDAESGEASTRTVAQDL